MATLSSILAWAIPWKEEPGMDYSSWDRKQLDMTEPACMINWQREWKKATREARENPGGCGILKVRVQGPAGTGGEAHSSRYLLESSRRLVVLPFCSAFFLDEQRHPGPSSQLSLDLPLPSTHGHQTDSKTCLLKTSQPALSLPHWRAEPPASHQG